jgi:hypothetical protein
MNLIKTDNNMEQKKLHEAKKLAKKAGFHDAKLIGKWKGYEVVEPIFTDGETHFVGMPQYLLCKDGKLRWTEDYQESLDIMDDLQ